MEITNAEFVISNTDVKKCPAGTFPEYAFIGRSNVGKSSLINMLTGRKGLAMTSATPGKTMLINHFLINNSWYLVDLPGYGYARRGQKGQEQIRTIIEDYILEREQMTNLFVLIDSRLEPQKIDLEFMEWLGENGIPFAIIFTKADKLKGGRLKINISAYLRELRKQWEELPPYFITSSEERLGRTEVLNYIESINKDNISKVVNAVTGHTETVDMTGTWRYTGSAIEFESENLLKKAGGTVAASAAEQKLDEQLAKVGIKEGQLSFTFNADSTFVSTLGKRKLNGTYSYDAGTQMLHLRYMKLIPMNAKVNYTTQQMDLLFEADKLLKLITFLSSKSSSATLKAISSLADSYDGMMLGYELKR